MGCMTLSKHLYKTGTAPIFSQGTHGWRKTTYWQILANPIQSTNNWTTLPQLHPNITTSTAALLVCALWPLLGCGWKFQQCACGIASETVKSSNCFSWLFEAIFINHITGINQKLCKLKCNKIILWIVRRIKKLEFHMWCCCLVGWRIAAGYSLVETVIDLSW